MLFCLYFFSIIPCLFRIFIFFFLKYIRLKYQLILLAPQVIIDKRRCFLILHLFKFPGRGGGGVSLSNLSINTNIHQYSSISLSFSHTFVMSQHDLFISCTYFLESSFRLNVQFSRHLGFSLGLLICLFLCFFLSIKTQEIGIGNIYIHVYLIHMAKTNIQREVSMHQISRIRPTQKHNINTERLNSTRHANISIRNHQTHTGGKFIIFDNLPTANYEVKNY